MTPTQTFFRETDLERAMLVGYYGGGNYGDELLLEIIANLLAPRQYQHIRVAYQDPVQYPSYHHDFGYELVDTQKPLRFIGKLLTSKKIVIGGGGLWGMDVNSKIFLLSVILFFCRWILGRKVYLVGVGYYESTSMLGHLSAWFAARAANRIIVRDKESVEQFDLAGKTVDQDNDIAWLADSIDETSYQPDIQQLEKLIPLSGKALFIALRHFRGEQAEQYHKQIGNFLENNQHQQIVVALLQPPQSYPEGHRLLRSWQQLYPNVHVLEQAINPMGLFLFMKKYRHQLAVIAPQFHAIITAHAHSIPFLPVVYDNKVSELLDQIKQTAKIPINELNQKHLQQFADNFYKGTTTQT